MNRRLQASIAIGSALISVIAIVLAVRFANADTNPGTNIDSTYGFAWDDTNGWLDFHNTHTVKVATSTLVGYASSSVGELSLNCNSTPSGDICATSDFAVENYVDESGGSLSGCAWNDESGWVSFWCGDGRCDGGNTEDASSTCASSNYRVTIDSDGYFHGYAWNDISGWISFNCADSTSTSCAASDYKVRTDWRPNRMVGYLESVIIDTSSAGGTILQSITWHGTKPNDTSVDFQVAFATSTTGPWSYLGPGGSITDYYGLACPQIGTATPATGAAAGTPICVQRSLFSNARYLRYRVRLQTDVNQTVSPTITDIVLNWGL